MNMEPKANIEAGLARPESSVRVRRQFVPSRELGLLLLLVFIVILFRLLFPRSWEHFATFTNFSSVVRNMAFEGILALGMMLMLVGGRST
jgi:ribose/xylose/arabinose/galactoside ABC-type transport system permease subunit